MKQFFPCLVACLTAALLSAQVPANDNCDGAVDLGTAPNCTPTVYSNVNATPSDIGLDNVPSCFGGGTPGNDVWFYFTCPTAPVDFRVELTGVGANPITGTQLAVYRGDCSLNGLAELDCISIPAGLTDLYLDLEDLTAGAVYFIRVSDFDSGGASNPGAFNLCVNEIPPIFTIDQVSTGLCQGTIYDSGGPDGNYSANENHTFTICPNAPSACIDFTLEYFSLDAGPDLIPGNPGNDQLSFYDGPDVNAPLVAQINGFSPPFGTDGGGGVCFRVQATSGCLTIQFQSDQINEFEGFKGQWNCSASACNPIAPIEVETAVTDADIVNAVLAPGTEVTITNIDCAFGAYGTFEFASDNNDLGLRKGLVLTSGSVDLIPGPNNDDGATVIQDTPGDADLDYLSFLQGSLVLSEDACVIEMDVFVASDELTFEYVFGSEEYPEYADDIYNDIFAFLASGPGIIGDPAMGGAQNIAVLPGTNTPVQINSVNNLTNWEYYRNNGVWDGSSLEYDGFTADFMGAKKSLTARLDVIPCNTYHLKLAIADRFDALFDSGVFISEVRGGAPELAVDFASGLDYFTENCTGDEDQIVISLKQPKTQTVSYTITVGGSATAGTDYEMDIPNLITFQPGDSVLVFPIIPLADLEQEGTETITLSISKDFGCGEVVFQTLILELHDGANVSVNGGADTLYVCPGGTAQLQAFGAQNYTWEPALAVSDPNIPNPTITPVQDLVLKVTGTIGLCEDVDSIFVKMISLPTLEIQPNGAAGICQGDSLQLQAITNAGMAGISWTPKSRLSDSQVADPLVFPLSTTIYTASLQVPGCATVSEQITVNVDTLFFPEIFSLDTAVCPITPLQLAENLQSSTQYLWEAVPPGSLNNAAISGAVATPDQSSVYTLTVTSANQFCTQTASVNVNVFSVEIANTPVPELCRGDSIILNATANTFGASGTISWMPSGTGAEIAVFPDSTTLFTAALQIQPNCVVADSVLVIVHPGIVLNEIVVDPVLDTICEGSKLRLRAQAIPPDVEFIWFENDLEIAGENLDSLVVNPTGDINPVEVFYAVMATDNNGCAAMAGPVGLWVKRCLVFPNAFTPDGDGNNDTFGGILAFDDALEVLDFQIFNRWGQQVFEATPGQQTWDGRVNGKDAPSDVYVFYLTVRFANGNEETFKGDVTLLR